MASIKKTNQIFHLPRFWQYVRAHLSEKKRAYLWHFAVISMIYFIIDIIMLNSISGYRYEVQAFFYIAGLMTTGGVFALRYFSSLARGESALLILMQPVSCFEKWLMAALTILLGYPLLYTLCFLVLTVPFLVDGHIFIPFLGRYYMSENGFYNHLMTCIVYVGLTGYVFATSILFKRLPIIKSIALGFALFLIFLLIATSVRPSGHAYFVYFVTSEKPIDISFSATIISVLAWIVTPTLLWVSSFFMLKERDL